LIHEFVTGGGLAGSDLPPSWAAEGGAMVRALAREFAAVPGLRVLVTRDHRLSDLPGPWEQVRVGPGKEPAAFERLAAGADFILPIAPECQGLLENRARAIERLGGRSLGSRAEAVARTTDKRGFFQELKDAGIPTPETWRHGGYGLLHASFRDGPFVVKPIDGAGSTETRIVRELRQLAAPPFDHEPSRWIVQPFVSGAPMSASFLADGRGSATLICCGIQHMIVSENGGVGYSGGTLPIEIEEHENIRRSVHLVPGLVGWVGVDFIRETETGRTVVLEVNPRPTTSLVGVAALVEPGRLAAAWLELIERGSPAGALALAEALRVVDPIRFQPDGTIGPAALEAER